jgi:SAM-dependent methyltransferase
MSELRDKKWWESFYNDTMADMFLIRSGEAEKTCRFLAGRLNISPGAVVFDQCCGIGSLSIPLARGGAQVIGVDQCESYIERARRSAAALHVSARYDRADAFEFVPERPCDAAFNWGSSFGYADEDRQNLTMLQRAYDALKPGGRFILDYQNIPGVLRGFRQCIVRRHVKDDGEILLLRESNVNLAAGRLEQQWTYVLADGRRIVEQSSLRLYLPHAIAEMFRSCGFTDIAFYGGVQGEELTIDSPRCICQGSKR